MEKPRVAIACCPGQKAQKRLIPAGKIRWRYCDELDIVEVLRQILNGLE